MAITFPKYRIQIRVRTGWRVRLEMARLWRDAVNSHGGDVTVVHLPEIGIKGNVEWLKPVSDEEYDSIRIAGN